MIFGLKHLALFAVVIAGFGQISANEKSGYDFGYDGENGPDYWPDQFEKCAGKYQSPINIEEHLVQRTVLPPMRFHGFQALPVTSTITNNGHTVMLQLNTSEVASVNGGPLQSEYVFSQLHFHWGANDSSGSEDLINNHSFPMELHMVLYKNEYENADVAGRYKDGLAVMAFFFEAIDTDHPIYADIVEVLEKVIDPDTNARLRHDITLDSLMSVNRVNYYTYHGSLTTPPCSEVVTWIDFKEPVLLSHDQIARFRLLRSHDGQMTHNNRPTQPLGERLVWYNHGNGANTLTNQWCFMLAVILACLITNK